MTIILIVVAMKKAMLIKDNDKTRPARPLCPNHQNFPSHSNATPQMLPQKIVFFSRTGFFPSTIVFALNASTSATKIVF